MRLYLAILLVLGTTAVSFAKEGVPDVSCPILSCPSVPPECSEISTFIFRGKTCKRCPTWKTDCVARGQMPDPSKMAPCPTLGCPLIYIPPDCMDYNIDVHNGKSCRGCPKLKPGCITPRGNSSEMPQKIPPEQTDLLPICRLPCPRILIPAECQEYEILEYDGQRCKSCPKWKMTCTSTPIDTARSPISIFPTANFIPSAASFKPDIMPITRNEVRESTTVSNNAWQISTTTYGLNNTSTFSSEMITVKMPGFLPPCSKIVCSMIMIPEECRDYETRQYQGMLCRGCQVWKKNCSNSLKSDINSLIPCPNIVCPSIEILDECKDYEVGQHNDQRCKGCPKWKENCSKSQPKGIKILLPDPNFLPACRNITCPVITIPDECLDYEVKQNFGEPCKGCPTWKMSCKVPADIPSTISSFSEMPLCSNMACPLLLIKEECRDFEIRQHNGKQCRGCQIWKESCKQLQGIKNTGLMNTRNLEQCPNLVCTDNVISPQCREYMVIEFQGRPCRSCPTMKKNCTGELVWWSSRLSGTLDNLPDCPLLTCTLEFIPPSCRKYETRQYDGQPCRGCQEWKESCRSSPVNADGKLPHPMPSPTSALDLNPVQPLQDFQRRPGTNMMDCPAIQCPMMQSIPPECREPTTIRGRGGVSCPGCPRWRPGCQPLSGSGKQLDFIMTVTSRTETLTPTVRNLNDLPCPNLGCPLVEIPPQCKEERTFWFYGKQCKQCPTWNQRCRRGMSKNQSSSSDDIFDRLLSILLLRSLLN
ncbi:hypothetical protein CHS0354_005062 [Potamilus streckersoni]|uniref:Uncharacterized protein n=1 Tax=Potamilus streckersoni TaxID=2493646 RepID=A0AAE0SH17_9BIVA|nr:hypothetical protein CHS0354_005062 [Potamilus streckersoni]